MKDENWKARWWKRSVAGRRGKQRKREKRRGRAGSFAKLRTCAEK